MSGTAEGLMAEIQRLLTTAIEDDQSASQLSESLEALGTSTDVLRAYRERSKRVATSPRIVETPELRISATTS